MPDKEYSRKIHAELQKVYGKNFKLSEDEFVEKVSSDEDYARTIHIGLKSKFGKDLTISEDDFVGAVKKKDNSQSFGGGEDGTKPQSEPKGTKTKTAPMEFTPTPTDGVGQAMSGIEQAKSVGEEKAETIKPAPAKQQEGQGPKLTNFEKRIQNPVNKLQNEDGTTSTHKMMSWESDGKYFAAPTIVEVNGKLKELNPEEAIDYAFKNNEFKEFKTDAEAREYADNGYKKGTPLEKGIDRNTMFAGIEQAQQGAQEQLDLEAQITAPQTAPIGRTGNATKPIDMTSFNKKYGQLSNIGQSVGGNMDNTVEDKTPIELKLTPEENKLKQERDKLTKKAIDKGITTEQYKKENFDKAANKYVSPDIKAEYETYNQIDQIKKDLAAYKAEGNTFQAEVSQTKLEAAQQKLDIKKANTDRKIDSRIAELTTLIDESKKQLNSGAWGAAGGNASRSVLAKQTEYQAELDDLKFQKQAFFKPLEATKAKIAEYGVKVDSWDQIKEYYATIQSEYEDLLEKNPIAVGAVGKWTGDSERVAELYNQVRTLAPIVLANRTPSNKNDSSFSVFGKTALQTFIPSTKGPLQTQAQVAQSINQTTQLAGVNPNDINLPVAEALKKQATYEPFSAKDWASMAGLTTGMLPYFAFGGNVVGNASKVLQAEKVLANIVTNPKAYKWAKYIGGAVQTGLEYEAAGLIAPHLKDETSFWSGFTGNILSKPAEKLFNKIGGMKILQNLFKENAQEAVDIFERVGKLVATGTGEVIEEYGNEFGNLFEAYATTGDAEQLRKDIDERFGTVSKNFHFAVMSFVMGAGMGAGNAFGSYSTNEAKKAYNNLSEEEKGKFDEFVGDVNKDIKKATKSVQERDAEIKTAKEGREKLGIKDNIEVFNDVPETVTKTMDRFDEQLPLDKTAVEEASSYLYDKYKELEGMKSIEEDRTMTTEEIEAIQSDLETDITNLENYLATGEYAKPKVEETPIVEQPEVKEVVAEEITVKEEIPPTKEQAKPTEKVEEKVAKEQTEEVKEQPKPTPQKIKVLGEDVNIYNGYIPSKVEDVEPNALYTFHADSKDGIPTLLHDKAYTNTREVNGVKTEKWHVSISGDELLKLYPKTEKPKTEKPKANIPMPDFVKNVGKNVEEKPTEAKPKANIPKPNFAPKEEVKGEVKSIKELENENKKTLPKVRSEKVFKNKVETVSREKQKEFSALGEDEINNLPTEKVPTKNIVPTQTNVTIPNLEKVAKITSDTKIDEPIILLKDGDNYYVADGHHRIANEILNGNENIEAKIFDLNQPNNKQNETRNEATDATTKPESGKETVSEADDSGSTKEKKEPKLKIVRPKKSLDQKNANNKTISKALSIEAQDVEDIVMQSFASGGSKVTREAIQSLVDGKGEKNVRIQFTRSANNGGKTIDGIVDDIWNSLSDEQQANTDTEKIKDIVNRVILENNSPQQVAQKLNDKYKQSGTTTKDGKTFDEDGSELFETPYGLMTQEQIDDFHTAEKLAKELKDQELSDEEADIYNQLTEEELEDLANGKAAVEDIVAEAESRMVAEEVETENEKQQIETFGVPKSQVNAVHSLIDKVVTTLNKAGLTAAKTVGEWLDIGKGKEKTQSLKINGKDVQVKPIDADVVNGFYSPLEKVINETKFEKLPAKQWIDKFAKGEEAKWTGLTDWLSQQQGSVSKADIQQYLKDNRIEVVEVVKDGEISEEEIDTLLADEVGQDMTRDEAREYLSNDENNEQTKFSQYQAPLSRDTEVLTIDGWVTVDKLNIGDIVISRSDEDGKLEWVKVEATPSYFSEKLIHFSSSSLDVLCTPQHTMLYLESKYKKDNKIRRATAEKLFSRVNTLIPLTGSGIIGDVEQLYGLDGRDVGELIGWFISEGSFSWAKGRKQSPQIAQTESHNPKNCRRIEGLLGRLKIKWSKNGNSYYLNVKTMPKELVELLKEQPTSLNKFIPKFLFNTSKYILEGLYDGLFLGDGTTISFKDKVRNPNPQEKFYTSSLQLANDFQILLILIGKVGNIKQVKRTENTEYVINIKTKQTARADKAKREYVDYNDIAYCVTVKNHAICIRRNGIVSFTGNSGEKENYKEVLVTFPQSKQQKEINRLADKYGVENTYISLRTSNATDSELEFVRSLKNDQFKSSHFDEPNILVHLRMNTRTDTDGNKVLFLEEVQSDWGQKGKKEGFTETEQEYNNRLSGVIKKQEDVVNKEIAKQQELSGSEKENHFNNVLQEEKAKLRKLKTEGLPKKQATPSAPFVTDTNSWTKLGLKVALKEAVKQGADKIAWSTGTQQFDRWGSEEIHWNTVMKPKGFEIVVKDDAKRPIVRGSRIKSLSSNDGSQNQQAEVKRLAEKWNLKPEDLEVIPSKGQWTLAINEQTDAQAFQGNEEALRSNKLEESDISVGTKAELRDAIKRNLSRERNDAEIDKLTDRIWNRMQTEDSGTSLPRKEGMEEFYGNPKDMERAKDFTVKKEGDVFAVKDEKGKTIRTFKQENEANKFKENYGLGIVGNVAKSLFKQEVGTVEIQSENFDTKKIQYLADKYDVPVSMISKAVRTEDLEHQAEIGLTKDEVKVVEDFLKGSTKQHTIDITPELKKQVESGQSLFDKNTETKTLADKVRALKSKGTLQTDFTLGLKDLALEEIAQLIEDGTVVIEAIAQVLKDAKYAKLDKDEITKQLVPYTPMFKEWFGDWENDQQNASVVVEADGTPKVVFHGTNRKFDEFRLDVDKNNNQAVSNDDIFGIDFTDDVDNANYYNSTRYSKGADGEYMPEDKNGLMRVFLNIKNPAIIDIHNPTSLAKYGLHSKSSFKEMNDALRKDIKENKRDGIIKINIKDPYLSTTYKVFDPKQILIIRSENKPLEKGNKVAQKIRSLKSKGTLQTDFTLGLKDYALEEMAQLIEDGTVVIEAIKKVLANSKYASLNKDEIRNLVFSANPLTEKDFERNDSEKVVDRNKRLEADLKQRGYTQNEIDYILRGGVDRIEKVDTVREETKVVDNLNKILKSVQAKAKDMPLKEAVDKAIEQVQGDWVKGKEIILENAIRKFKKEHGVDKAVKPKPIKISVDEKKALIDQIKTLNRGAKIITDGFKEISAKINDIIKEYKTTISTRQLNAIQKRMAYLKVGSNESIRKFVDYVEKVLADAEYADQLAEVKSTNKKLKKALKNDKIPASVRATASDFIKIDPSDVTDLNKHQEYANELYEAMKSGGVKTQDGVIVDKTRKAADLSKIDNYIEKEMALAEKRAEQSMNEEYQTTAEAEDNTDEIKAYVQRKFDNMKAMVGRMLERGVDMDGNPIDFTPEEVSMIKKVMGMKLDQLDNIKDWYEATEALDHLLTNGDLGLIPHILNKYQNAVTVKKGTQTLINKMAGNISLLPITKFFAQMEKLVTTTIPFGKRNPKDSYGTKIFFDNSSFRRWDNLVKNFKDYGIYESTFYHLAKAYANYKTLVRQMDAQRISKELFASNGYDQKKTLESKFKITAFLRQLEFESNPESKTNKPAIDYLNATIEAAENLNHPIQGKALDMLKDVVSKHTVDGQISLESLRNSFTQGEKKAIADLQKTYKALAPYHNKVSLAIRNKAFTAIENYSHISAYSKDNKVLTPSETKRQYTNVLQGTKSGTIEQRSGAASAINLDPFSTANKAVRDVMLDYWMTNPFKNVEKILDNFAKYSIEELKKYPRGTAEYENALKRRNIADAWQDIYSDARENMLGRSYFETNPFKEFMQLAAKRAVEFTLGKPDRLLAELFSNMGFVMSSATKEFALGSTKYLKYNGGEIQAKIMENVQSSATERLHPHGGIATSVMDTQDFDIAVADDQNISSPVRRKALQFYYNTLAKGIGAGQMINEGMITSGDLLIARPIWTGTMATEFKKITGKDIDFDKISENDIEYMDANEEAIDKARTVADRNVTDAAASKNPFETAPKMSNRSTQILQALNTYMRGFNMNEYELASDALMHLVKGGKMSAKDATRILSGISARAGLYKAVQAKAATAMMAAIMGGWAMLQNDEEKTEVDKLIGNMGDDTPENRRKVAAKLLELFATSNPNIPELAGMGKVGDALKTTDEETVKFWKRATEEPNTFIEDFVKGIGQQYLSLLTQRNFGNIVQGFLTAPLFEEYVNKKLRDDYDPYKDSYLYSKLPDTGKKNWLIRSIEANLGAYGLPLAMLMDITVAGIELRINIKKLDAVNEELKKHIGKVQLEKNKLEDWYDLKDRQKSLEKKIEYSYKSIAKEVAIAAGMGTGAIPALKNIDKAMDKIMQDAYKLPKDWEKIQEKIEAIKNGVAPEDIMNAENKQKAVSEIYDVIEPGEKMPDKYDDAIKKVLEK